MELRPLIPLLLSTLVLPATALAQLPPQATENFYVSNFVEDELSVYSPTGQWLRRFTTPGLDGPRGIVWSDDEKIFVASQLNDLVLVFDHDESFLFSFSHPNLDGPTGMCLNPAGELYVSSFNNDRVLVFDANGVYQREFTGGGLNAPNCVAVDSTGAIYVASAFTARVIKFDASESYLFNFTGAGLSSPMGIALDESDVLYVAGGASDNIVKFSTSGTTLGQITHPDLTGPQGVAFDENGHLWSSSFYQDVIVEFDATEAYVQTIDAGQLDIPRSIAFARPRGTEPGTAVCFGDGTGSPCPCGNDSVVPGTGCVHSRGVGMTLSGAGSSSLAADDLTLTARDVPAGNTGIFYVGRTALAGTPLYDGLQCSGGSVLRFRGHVAGDGTASDTGFVAQDTFGLYWQAGETYTFQYFTRDNQTGSSPCGGFANLSPGYAVTMTP